MSEFATSMNISMQPDPSSRKTDGSRTELGSLAERVAAEFSREPLSPSILGGLMRIVEFTGLAVIATIIMFVYVGWHLPERYAVAITVGSALFIALNEYADGYDLRALRKPLQSFARVALTWSATFALLALAGFLLKTSEDFSRVWTGSWYLSGMAFLFLVRMVIGIRIRKWAKDGTMERRAVIVGGGKPAEKLIRTLEKQRDNDIHICGIFDDRDDVRSPPIVAGYPKLGNTEQLVSFARQAHIDLLIVSLPLSAEERVLSMLKKLWVLPVDIRLSAHSNRLQFRPRTYSYVGAVPTFAVFDKPIRDWHSIGKRVFDIAFSLLGIIAFSPVMLATAIAIKLDSPGPVLFRQKRHGFNNEEIEVFKFRSMYSDQCDPTARVAVTRNDSRVTRVGRFIRKTSIDELPQFFNVLRGNLSLVGPRPHAVAAQSHDRLFTEVVDGYFARHRVKPGVTGWAQVNGWRGEIDSDEKIQRRTEFDLYYIENWSVWLDLKILFLTPLRLLTSKNAY